MNNGLMLIVVGLWAILALALPSVRAESDESTDALELPKIIQFNRDVRPILSEHCFACHGPDENKRKADLRLDTEEGAFADLEGQHAIVPGDLDASLLATRIIDDFEPMPPERFEKPLTKRQIALIRKWIEQGAKWQQHWSFIPPQRVEAPQLEKSDWARNPIDAFIADRLARDGLKPSPEATKEALIRRVTLDLTGLPPSLEEVDAFLEDESPDAYEKVVERLLASPHHAERLALQWLDLSRYADTHGYHIDSHRDMWRWRDWVIDSFKSNKPFDDFTIEQLAGDLLPDATVDQKVATGFNRNHMINYEGGAIPEEYLNMYIVDRVNTTSTVWLGLTMGCAQCHDHKYDTITTKDYYSLYAFFNHVPENGLDGRTGNAMPFIKAPLPDQKQQLDVVRGQRVTAENRMKELEPRLAASLKSWERDELERLPEASSMGLIAHYEFEGHTADTSGGYRHGKVNGDALVYEAGTIQQAASFKGKSDVDAGDTADFERTDAFSYGAWVKPANGEQMAVLSRMSEAPSLRGYDLYLNSGMVFVHLIHDWPKNSLRVNTKTKVPINQWRHVMVTYDGSSKAEGVRVYIDGESQELTITNNSLTETIRTDKPLFLGRRLESSTYTGGLDDVRLYDRWLAAAEVQQLAKQQPFRAVLAMDARHRTPDQNKMVRERYLGKAAPPEFKVPYDKLVALRDQETKLLDSIPTSMVMQEMGEPRETFVLVRGSYDQHGEKVTPNVPASLPSLPNGAAPNRLGLAQWLVDPSNPLTARVAVNRWWQMYFGYGIVKTVEDFGAQGEWPVHPELLDWLATEFVQSGWDVRHLQRLIVTSATYRQASRVTPDLIEKDPQNRLLARGPRLRMEAEFIRDSALFVSGLLHPAVGGPSVSPYQPAGLWREVSYGAHFTAQFYQQGHGDDLYRRSMYTFWKRTAAPPALVTFDAPDREICTARRSRTNTPLQALVLLNDPTYVEASRKLAERIMLYEVGSVGSDEAVRQRMIYAFRLAFARQPVEKELAILTTAYERQLVRYATDITAALDLINQGESGNLHELNIIELASWTTVASMIFNLDEMVTKP